MPLPHNDSLVTFPSGMLTGRATALSVTTEGDRRLIVTDSTPCHPVDFRWPDQGPDRGTVTVGDRELPLVDCVVGATDGSALYVGDAVPVRRGEPGWAFVVVHVVPAGGSVIAEGDRVTLTVDPDHRAALSAGHTGCHTAALALNAAMAGRWRKQVATDGLGNPSFDQLSITSSRIEPFAAVDRYRIGRSLRKKGFHTDGLAAALPDVVASANELLAGWVATGAAITVETGGPALTDLREWVCHLPSASPRIPCGGTHLHSLAEVASISVGLDYDEGAGALVMRTGVTTLGD